MPLFDRVDLRALDAVPTLDDLMKDENVAGVFFVKEADLITGFHRQMYMSGLVALELDSDGAAVRAYQLVKTPVPEPVV